jgi:vacuolar-type H+-ATPase subunit E/Vma4
MSENTISETDQNQQSILSIKKVINAQAEESITKIKNDAQKEKDRILKSAKLEAEKIEKDKTNIAEANAKQNKLREVSRKKLSAKMEFLKLREEIIDSILVETRSAIQKFTQTDKYSNYLEKILEESATSIGGGNLKLELRKEDKSLLSKDILEKISESVTKSTGLATKFIVEKSDLQSIGGVNITRDDDKLMVNNTFESKLERNIDEIRVLILNALK